MRFANEIRKDVEAETGLKGIHTAGPISAKWNAKSDEEKEIYNQQFRDEMIGYKEEMEAYKQTPEYKAAQVQKKAKKAGKKPKDRNAPKRPMSGYFLFGNSVREQVQEELGTKDFKQVSGRINEMWKEADQEEFKAQADTARVAYKKLVGKYQQTKQYAEYQERVTAWKQNSGKAVKKVLKKKK